MFVGGAACGAAAAETGVERSATVEADAAGPRVILLVEEPELEALLIAGLADVRVLTRAELPKLTAERLFAGGSVELTSAEVALVVERSGDRGIVKVVQCESGATVVVLELPKMPVAETARWIVARTRPLFGSVADPMRPRISLPGLRFVTDSAENRVMERAINLMLTARLQARGAVVLERWRMGDLVFEKSLVAQESPFWRAAQIVDGSVSATDGKWTARVRIRDEAGAETSVQAEGGAVEELADDVSTRVLTGRWKTDVGTKREIEAAAFVAEAKWMLDHGLPREAWQATESALALGVEPRREAEMLRVKAAAMCAYPDDLSAPRTIDGGNVVRLDPSELATRVFDATEAMWLAGDYWNAHPTKNPPEWWTLEHPANLCVYSLYTGLRVLRAAHDAEGAVDREAVRRLRASIRRNVALLQTGELGRLRPICFIYLTQFAAYWNETPEDTIAFYRMVLAPDFNAGDRAWPAMLRGELSYLDNPHPPFLGSARAQTDSPVRSHIPRVFGRDEAEARRMWGAFMEELARSPHLLNRADSLALRWQSTPNQDERYALTARMIDFLAEHPEALAGPFAEAIFEEFIRPLREVNSTRFLADAQQKLVDIFVSLLGSEAPVSPVIISGAWVPLSDYKMNVRDGQAREVLAALAVRRARASVSESEISAVDSARSSLLREFPALHPVKSTEDGLAVRSFWMASEHGPERNGNPIGFEENAAVWTDGFLWVADSIQGRLWKIEPKTGEAEVFSPENRPNTRFGLSLVGWGKRFAITAGRSVWVLNEAKTRWEKLDLPEGRYQIAAAHGDLWAVSGEDARTGHAKGVEGNALYRITSALTCELVASSRRRPAEHPLDSSLAGVPFSLSPARGGGVVIGGWGNRANFIDSVTGGPSKRANEWGIGNLQITSTPGLIIRTKHVGGDRHGLVRVEFLDAAEEELLLCHPKLGRPERARFSYPEELDGLPASRYAVTWSNDGIDILAWASRGGITEAWLVRIDAKGCVVHPLSFELPADADERVRASGREPKFFRNPRIEPKGLIATAHGLVIMGQSMAGFWFIPNEDLDKRRVRASGP